MQRFEDLLSHHLMSEAISLKNAKKKRLSKKYSGAYNERLDEVFGGKNRLMFQINLTNDLVETNPIFEDIRGWLIYVLGVTITPNDYKLGYYIKDKNTYKIGRMLQKYSEEKFHNYKGDELSGNTLLDVYKKDPTRSSKEDDYYVVISRHPYDIAGASTDRNWTSCMDLGTPRIIYKDKPAKRGSKNEYVPNDIKEGTLVAYVVPKSDLSGDKPQIRRPVSRILMRPYKGDSDIAYAVGKMYGNKYSEFEQFVLGWVGKNLNHNLKDTQYHMSKSLYNDNDEDKAVNFIISQTQKLERVFKQKIDFLDEYMTVDAVTEGSIIAYKWSISILTTPTILKSIDFSQLKTVKRGDHIINPVSRKLANIVFDQIKTNRISIVPNSGAGKSIIQISTTIACNVGEPADIRDENWEDIMYEKLNNQLAQLSGFKYQKLMDDIHSVI
jgi:hypothetical protein